MTILFADTETYSSTPIKNGTYAYAYAPDTEVTLFSYAFDDEPVKVIDLANGEKLPKRVLDALEDESVTVVFHNAMFDRNVINKSLKINLNPKRLHCTMVQAFAHGLPGKLDVLCDIFKLSEDKAKHKNGRALVLFFCKPKGKDNEKYTKTTHPAKWEEFKSYAINDTVSMRELYHKIPKWNYVGIEKDLWVLDQHINDRGFTVDLELANKALEAVNIAQNILADRTKEATDGEVAKASQRDVLLKYILKEHGIELPNMQAATLRRRLEDPDLPDAVKDLIAIRLETSTTSTAKYKSLLRAVSSDGKLRGMIQYDGAARTRRASGRTWQIQNLPKPTHSSEDIELGIKAIKSGCADLIFDNVMGITSSCVRGCIIPAEKRKILVSDLSNIEGRIVAWLAGEEWKIKAFRDFDNGIGHDLYKLAYAKAFKKAPEEVTKDERTVGKVLELSMGYAGGVSAFLTFAAIYNLNLDEIAKKVIHTIPKSILTEAKGFYDWTVKCKRSTFGLDKDTFVVCDSLKRMWREAHPAVVSFWAKVEVAAEYAISNKGKRYFATDKVVAVRNGAWLNLILPSGARLCYPAPTLEKNQISYMGLNQYSKKWQKTKTFGGKLLENLAQSIARDIMYQNMFRVEEAGYTILSHVHDELITEAPDTEEYSAEHLSSLLATNPDWTTDLPLAAGGFACYRYAKH